MKCDPTGAGRTVIFPGAHLRCECAGDVRMVRVAAVRTHKNRLLLRIDGIDDANAAAALFEGVLYAPHAEIRLADGEYLDDDLIGCAIVGRDGTSYGAVESVEHFPASDMLVVRGAMVPMVRAIVAEIDLPGKKIVIDPPEGLLEPLDSEG